MTKARSWLAALALCAGALAPLSFAHAQSAPLGEPLGNELQPAPLWADLTPAERSALAPIQRGFDALDAQQRRKWRAFVPRFERMSPKERQNAQSKMERWARMTPEERLAARAQALRDREQSRSHRSESWEKWRGLSESEREALSEQAARARR